MSHDETKRRVLARRARFMTAAGIAGAALSASTPAHADDASVDDAAIDGGSPDGSIFVEAGIRSDGGDDDGDLVDAERYVGSDRSGDHRRRRRDRCRAS